MQRFWPLATIVIATGCASTPPAGAPTVAAGVRAQRTQGELAIAAGKLGFAPCTATAGTAVDATPATEVTALLRELNAGSDGSAFVDVDAAQGDDGSWRIDRMHRASRDGERCRENPRNYVWQAAGDDPAWSMEATTRYVVVRRGAGTGPDHYRFHAFVPTAEGAWTFSARNQTAAVNIVLHNTTCRAGNGRGVSTWSIELTTHGERLQGCAWNGTAADPP